MARKNAALVASALLLLAAVLLSLDGGGVDAWCIEYSSTINSCRGGSNRGVNCCRECVELGYDAGQCKGDGSCACINCADQKVPACG